MTRTDNMPRVRFVCVCARCGCPTNGRLSQLLAEKWAKALGWVDRPDSTKGPREQMICRACAMEDDLYRFVLGAATCCDGIDRKNTSSSQCLRLASLEVSWSDRTMHVCEEHLEYAKRMAAEDGPSDRTDTPRVSDC